MSPLRLLFAVSILSIAGAANAVSVVVPNSLAGSEGDSNNCFPFACTQSMRYQQAYDSSQFGTGLLEISEVAFRVDSSALAPSFTRQVELQIDLSTSANQVGSLVPQFANNIGADAQNVLAQQILLLQGTQQGGGGPNAFDVRIVFDQSFFYDPSLGDLLMDVRVFGATQIDPPLETSLLDYASSDPNLHRVFSHPASDVNATFGDNTAFNGLVTEFTFVPVPEPTSGALLALGLAGLGLRTRRRRASARAALGLGAIAVLSSTVSSVAQADPAIEVLSNRSDLVSAGDVLVEVVLPDGTPPAAAVLEVNGGPASFVAGQEPDGRYLVRVTDLALGQNTLTVILPDSSEASATIVNHPNGGPVFSGPQTQPWKCRESGVLDAQCNKPAEYTYLYESTDTTTTGLLPYDPQNPPSDVATTTTNVGVTLPFIVRQERGWQDRDEYKILTLFQPGTPWEPWSPQAQWNRKLLVTHGGGCGSAYGGRNAPLDDYAGTIPANPALEQSYVVALGQGFAVMSTALDNNGHNCNIVLQAESLMMAKERLIEQYGELRYTIGTGCSGGSLAQQQISNAYPGIYQGLLTMCSYPDTFSAGVQFADLHLLRRYFNDFPADCSPGDTSGCSFDDVAWVVSATSPLSRGIVWTEQQWADVEGHLTHVNAVAADDLLFKEATHPTANCGDVPAAQRYDAVTNPGGVRCGILDYMLTVLGPRPPEVWTPVEQAAGRGFAGAFIDNVGIQYGLGALREGKITPAQFVDLNVYIGGFDLDVNPTPERIAGDPTAIVNSYRSGAINMTNNLNRVAMINFTGPDPGIAHDTLHSFWTRWRLDREHGNHDNHVIWAGPAPLIGDPYYVYQGLTAMDLWLASVEQDSSNTPLAQKLTQNKPANIHDQCSDGAGHKVLDDVCPEEVMTIYGTPRTVAEGPLTDDTLQCQLEPFDAADITVTVGGVDTGVPIVFTPAQLIQLEALYASGVCDYDQAGAGQQGATEWMGYGDATTVIYGGAPLPPPPADSAGGWASDAFLAEALGAAPQP